MRTVVTKSDGKSFEVKVDNVELSSPSIVQLSISPESISGFERSEDDLHLTLQDGRIVLVQSFFVLGEQGERSDLVLEDSSGVFWWGQYAFPWSEFHFTEVETNSAGTPLWWLLGGLGASGGGLVAATSGGGDKAPVLALTGDTEARGEEDQSPLSGQLELKDASGVLHDGRFEIGEKPENGSVSVDPSTGEWVYTPNADWEGEDSFVITVVDGQGKTHSQTIEVTVAPTQDAFDDFFTVAADQPNVIDVLANDRFTGENPRVTHVEGQPISPGGAPVVVENGTVTLGDDGQLIFTPSPDYWGTASFTYTAVTDSGVAETAVVTLDIIPDNYPPTADDKKHVIEEDSSASGRIEGHDLDGDKLTYTKGSDPKNGTVTVNPDGTYTYTPTLDYNGTDSFTVIVSDGNGGTVTSTVTIEITPVNDAPTAPDKSHLVPEDTVVTGRIEGHDVDGDKLTYTKGSDPENGTVTVNPDGSYTYTPTLNYNGTDSFTVIVSDGNGGTVTSTVHIELTPVNDAPTAPDAKHVVAVDTVVSGSVDGQDVDGDTLTYTKGSDPENGTVTVNPDGTYTYTPTADFNGSDSFTVIVSDGNGGTVTSTITIDLIPSLEATDSAYESILAGGTNEGDEALETAGTVTVQKGFTVVATTETNAYGTFVITADGEYSFQLAGPIDHSVDPAQTTFYYDVEDADGHVFTNSVVITIVDDLVQITAGKADPIILVDEADLNTPVEVDFSGLFAYKPGADGLQSAVYELTLGGDSNSGLVDSQTNSPISLTNENGVIVGRLTDGSGDVAFTVQVDPDTGAVTLTQERPVKHGPADADDSDLTTILDAVIGLTLTVEDTDGDTNSLTVNIGERLQFQDDVPLSSSLVEGAVYESSLDNGSDPRNAATPFKVSGQLSPSFGADGEGTVRFVNHKQNGGKTAIEALTEQGLLSGGQPIQYKLSSDGRTLLGYKVEADDSETTVFTATLAQDQDNNWTYEFSLENQLDHGSLDRLVAGLLYETVDSDGDFAISKINVTIHDDPGQPAIRSVDGTEDQTLLLNIHADATPSNIELDQSSLPSHGTVVITDDGRLEYRPADNFSGNDSFVYIDSSRDGPPVYITVNVTVAPVADAPDLGDDARVGVLEDDSVGLDLSLPVITDNVDQSPSGAGDHPERLGAIKLTTTGFAGGAAPAGTILTKDDGTPLLQGDDGSYTIIIIDEATGKVDDTLHIAEGDLPTSNVNYLTQSEYTSLRAQTEADNATNFKVNVSVTSYEVDDDGALYGITGAESTQVTEVYVKAVTDDAALIFDTSVTNPTGAEAPIDYSGTGQNTVAGVTILESNTLSLNEMLAAAFTDLDSSETRSIEILNTTGYTIVINGTEYADGEKAIISQKAGAAGQTGDIDSFGSITIGGMPYFSGDLNGILVTIVASDNDADGYLADDGTVVAGPAAGAAEADTNNNQVTLNLSVTPVINGVEVESPEATNEDTAVAALAGMKLLDRDGSETIVSVKFAMPDGWTLLGDKAGDGWVISGAGTSADPYIVTFDTTGPNVLDFEAREDVLASLQLLPPSHSSLDAELEVEVTVSDSSTQLGVPTGGTTTQHSTIDLVVNPVAETVGGNSANGPDGTSDVTMTEGHDYVGVSTGAEDEWFTLGVEGAFKLADGWSNIDGVAGGGREITYAELTPELVEGTDGESAIGSKFSYIDAGGTEVVVVYDGVTPVRIDVAYLDSLRFLPPEDVSGTFRIGVRAYTEDFDDDGGSDPVSALSGQAWLNNIVIHPVVDDLMVFTAPHVYGFEDSNIALKIEPTSTDPSETFDVTISDIPAGAELFYDGQLLADDGSGVVRIENFDKTRPLVISPPENSNVDFELGVVVVSKDGTVVGNPSDRQVIKVTLKGVADDIIVTQNENAAIYNEKDLDSGSTQITLESLFEFTMLDTDGSETPSFLVTGLPDGVTLVGATPLDNKFGADRSWVVTLEDYLNGTAVIVTPPNFSGRITFQVGGITTEDDGHSQQSPAVDIFVDVAASAEATTTTSAIVDEGGVQALNFEIIHQNGDTDETLEAILIKAAGSTTSDFAIMFDNAGTLITLDDAVAANLIQAVEHNGEAHYRVEKDNIGSLMVQSISHKDGDIGSFDFSYEITDKADGALEGSLSDTVITDSTFKLTARPVTDVPEAQIASLNVRGPGNSIETTPGTEPDQAQFIATLTTTDTIEVGFAVTSPDQDLSEHLIRILVSGVPEGVVVGLPAGISGTIEQTGINDWLVILSGDNSLPIGANGQTVPLEFTVGDIVAQGDHVINMIAQVQDRGDRDASTGAEIDGAVGLIQEASASWVLKNEIPYSDEGKAAATIILWEYNNAEAIEDTSFKLGDMINAVIKMRDSSAANMFTVTLAGVPDDAIVTGMTRSVIDGQVVWTATTTVPPGTLIDDAQDYLDALMASISVQAPANSNSNSEPFLGFNATLTTSVVGGLSNKKDTDLSIEVIPVTDPAELSIVIDTMPETVTELPIDITINHSNDGTHGAIIGGKLYLQINTGLTGAELQSGTLSYEGQALVLETVGDVDGIPAGDYYVVDLTDADIADGTVSVIYTPDTVKPGNVTIDALVQWQENTAPGLEQFPTVVETTKAQGTGVIERANNGVTVTSQVITSAEVETSNRTDAIELQGLSVSLIDNDGTERIDSVFLENVPNGFLVLIGTDAASAVIAGNAGGDADYNRWKLPVDANGDLPAYIAILPPAYWSGELNGLTLAVRSGELGMPATREEFPLESFIITPKANGLTLKDAYTYGNDSGIIAFNLSASMKDVSDASVPGAADAHLETTTLRLSGLGAHASFYVGTDQLDDGRVTFDSDSGAWTITQLTQAELNALGIRQAAGALTGTKVANGVQVNVEAWTVDGDDQSAIVGSQIIVNSRPATADGNDNILIWSGQAINGMGGQDTVLMRYGEDLTGSQLASKLKNIEIIDMSVDGANRIIDLTPENVKAMIAKGGTELSILGASDDQVSLMGDWLPSGNGAYIGTLADGETVTLQVSGASVLDLAETSSSLPGLDGLLASALHISDPEALFASNPNDRQGEGGNASASDYIPYQPDVAPFNTDDLQIMAAQLV